MAIAPDDYMVVQHHAERSRGFFDVLGHAMSALDGVGSPEG